MQTRLRKRQWLGPIAVLAVVALLVFAGFYLLDFFVVSDSGVTGDGGPLENYLGFTPDRITDALPSMAGMMAAVLGIVITVVSIIVQLSADRYTGVAQMFLRDRINIGVMAYFVIACVCGVWLSMSVGDKFVPLAAVLSMMLATTLGLVMMLPYFAYVFWFLEPSNIIARIREDAVGVVRRGTHADDARAGEQQVPAVRAMEELTDITSNSISGKDKIIASRAVDAMKDFVLAYLQLKRDASGAWFKLGKAVRGNPDFVAMDPESLVDLEDRKTWLEWKVLREYLGIYRESMSTMPDINYLIAIDTRYIGEAAADVSDKNLIKLCYNYMNSYMRQTLNAKDVRTAYNVLNQYRLLVESMITKHFYDEAVEGVQHMKYYGQVGYGMKLTFVTETAGYDISALCQFAAERKAPNQDAMLDLFLELDQPLTEVKQEKGLLGVRKAQVKLAAYYLVVGEEDKARRIADDMRVEPVERLTAIRDQLAAVTSKDFWEIIDRGRNFEYMPPSQREKMDTFFSWLDVK